MDVMHIILLTVLITLVASGAWYGTYLLRKLWFVTTNMNDLFESVESFQEHLEGLYELEMYYGDNTMQNLIAHSRQVVHDINFFKHNFDASVEITDLEEVPKDKEEGAYEQHREVRGIGYYTS